MKQPEALHEQAFLGSLLMFPDTIDRWMVVIDPDDFKMPLNRQIWDIIADLYSQGAAIDIVTVYDKFPNMEYLTACTEACLFSGHAPEYVRILKQRAYEAKICDIVRTGLRDKTQPETWAEQISLLPRYSEGKDYTMVELVKMVKDIASHKSGTAFQFNLPAIQRITGGLDRAELCTIGGHTSMGKSSLAIHLSIGFAEQGHSVLYCSSEMSEIDISRRLLANLGRVDIGNFRTGVYSQRDDDKVAENMEIIKNWKYAVKRTNTVTEIRSAINKYDPDIVIVDHLQNLAGTGSSYEATTANVGELQNICLMENVGMVMLSQFHRPPDKRHIMRPRLNDFKGSGGIEEKSTIAILCYWPDKADDKVMRVENEPEIYEVNVAKNRDGRTGFCKLDFYPEWSRFENFSGGKENHPPLGVKGVVYDE